MPRCARKTKLTKEWLVNAVQTATSNQIANCLVGYVYMPEWAGAHLGLEPGATSHDIVPRATVMVGRDRYYGDKRISVTLYDYSMNTAMFNIDISRFSPKPKEVVAQAEPRPAGGEVRRPPERQRAAQPRLRPNDTPTWGVLRSRVDAYLGTPMFIRGGVTRWTSRPSRRQGRT